MKNFSRFAFLAALATGGAWADGLTQVHPGYTMTDIQPTGSKFLVGGLSLYSNGDLAVCNWGNPGDVYILKDPHAGGASAMQVKRFAYGMQQVLGCTVVRDTLYVMQMGELTAVIDKNGDGVADEYNKVNDNFATSESLLGYAYDVSYLHGSFFATLASDVQHGGLDNNPSLKDRSVFIRMGKDNSTDILSGGFRNPNGMTVGYGNRLFAVDNQGSWEPLSKIIYLQKGKFYGHHNYTPTPFENQEETWPMLWLPRGSVDYQPGGLAFISEGIFKGQFFFAEPDMGIPGRIYRIYAEDVGGVMQGGVVAFSGGLSGVMRVAIGPGNVLYAGNLNSNGSWDKVSGMGPGLKRLVPKDVNQVYAFEILAVRSTGTNTLEVEFTKPLAAGAAAAANFILDTWTVEPVVGYGANSNIDPHALTVSSATLKPDGKTVVLTVSGLKLKYIIHIRLGGGVKSTTGETPWGLNTWMTLNAYGPGKVPPIAPCSEPDQYTGHAYAFDCAGPTGVIEAAPALTQTGLQSIGTSRISLKLPQDQAYSLRLYDVSGVERKVWQGMGPKEIEAGDTKIAPGLYFLKLQAGIYSGTLKLIQP